MKYIKEYYSLVSGERISLGGEDTNYILSSFIKSLNIKSPIILKISSVDAPLPPGQWWNRPDTIFVSFKINSDLIRFKKEFISEFDNSMLDIKIKNQSGVKIFLNNKANTNYMLEYKDSIMDYLTPISDAGYSIKLEEGYIRNDDDDFYPYFVREARLLHKYITAYEITFHMKELNDNKDGLDRVEVIDKINNSLSVNGSIKKFFQELILRIKNLGLNVLFYFSDMTGFRLLIISKRDYNYRKFI